MKKKLLNAERALQDFQNFITYPIPSGHKVIGIPPQRNLNNIVQYHENKKGTAKGVKANYFYKSPIQEIHCVLKQKRIVSIRQ